MMPKNLIRYFFSGLVFTLPILLTAWIIYYLYDWLTSYMSIESAAIALILLIIAFVVIGYLSSSYIGFKITEWFEKIILMTPVLGLIYKSLKDVTTAFVGSENKFSEPVLVKFTNEEVYKIGFVTNKVITKLLGNTSFIENESELLYSVYFPLSFSLSGDLYLVPMNRIRIIDRSAKEVMQTVMSGGLIKID